MESSSNSSLVFITITTVLVTFIGLYTHLYSISPPLFIRRNKSLEQTHLRVGLTSRESNLRTQHSRKIHGPQVGKQTVVQSLHIYPVKSCRGIELARSKVTKTGLEYDRIYTFACLKPNNGSLWNRQEENDGGDEAVWDFLTQRQLPLLASLKVHVWQPDAREEEAHRASEPASSSGGWITVRFPWAEPGLRGWIQRVSTKLWEGIDAVPEKEILLPLDFPPLKDIRKRGYNFAKVKIWKEVTVALNLEVELPPELALYLGASSTRLGLFRMDPEKRREVFRCAPRKEDAGFQPVVDFHDAVRQCNSCYSFPDEDSLTPFFSAPC